MKTLETLRLRLRDWSIDDLEDLYEYAKEPDTGIHAGWPAHTSKEESMRILDMFICNQDCWAIVEQSSGKVVGSFGLHKDNHRRNPNSRMIGYVIAKSRKGLGYATEAVREVLRHCFEDLSLDLVSVNHFDYNHASKRIIEKSGFHFEGVLRKAILRFDGALLDDYCYSLTREEWLALQQTTILSDDSHVRKATKEDLDAVTHMGILLWPDNDFDELKEEFRVQLTSANQVVLVYEQDKNLLGFVHCSLRYDYVESCETSPVGFLEGIFVHESYRQQGIARALVKACEEWAKQKGCVEFASDAELPNVSSQRFHQKIGFEESNRVVYFYKKLI